MSSLSRMIKRERRRKYRRLRKVFKARDMASECLNKRNRVAIKVSSILKFYGSYKIASLNLKQLAKDIYDRGGKMESVRPPKPPSRPFTVKK